MKRLATIAIVALALACVAGPRYQSPIIVVPPVVVASAVNAPTAWTPTWAISLSLTNRNMYCDLGPLYAQSNWQYKLLINVRSNVTAPLQYSGARLPGFLSTIGETSGKWICGYGASAPLAGTPKTNGWHFIYMTTTNLYAYLYTNNVQVMIVTSASFGVNSACRYNIGTCFVNNGPFWDVARVQVRDGDGVLQRDCIATGEGYFTNVADGAIYHYCTTNKSSSQSGNSSNIVGLVPNAVTNLMSWW